MHQYLISRDSSFLVDFDHLFDQVFAFRGDILELLVRKAEVALFNLVEEISPVRSIEGVFTGEK